MTTTAVILGVPVDDVTMAEAVEVIAGFVMEGRVTGRTHQVATVNADFIVNTVYDDESRRLLQATDLSIPDGMTVVWGSRLLGLPMRERVAGADLVPALARRAALEDWSMYLFGAAPGIADRAADLLRREHGVTVSSDAGPDPATIDAMDELALGRIIDARPDIICVALGNPKQERWIARHRHAIGAPVFIGVGGTFDLLVGEKRRAPDWVGRLGLEWLFRTAEDPRRLARRYAHDAVALSPRLAHQAWTGRFRRELRRCTPDVAAPHGDDDTTLVFRPHGGLRPADITALQQHPAMGSGGRILVDLSDVPFLDNVTTGCVVSLARWAPAGRGALFQLHSITPDVARSLLSHRLPLDLFAFTSATPAHRHTIHTR